MVSSYSISNFYCQAVALLEKCIVMCVFRHYALFCKKCIGFCGFLRIFVGGDGEIEGKRHTMRPGNKGVRPFILNKSYLCIFAIATILNIL